MPELEYTIHERFLQEYIFDLDGSAAILRTHCYKRQEYDGERWVNMAELDPESRKDRNYAGRIARRILRYPDVQERLEELLEEKALQTKITHDQITQEFLRIAQHECNGEPTHKEKIAALKELAKHTLYYEEGDKGKMKTFAQAMKELLSHDSDVED